MLQFKSVLHRIHVACFDLLFPNSALDGLQLFGRHSFSSREITFAYQHSPHSLPSLLERSKLTSCDLGINLHSRVCRYQFLREFNPLVDRNSNVLVNTSMSSPENVYSPLSDNCIVLHATEVVSHWSKYMNCFHPLAHAQHPVNLLDSEPMEDIRHQSLKSHILDTSNIFSPLEVIRGSVGTTLASIVDHWFIVSTYAERKSMPSKEEVLTILFTN